MIVKRKIILLSVVLVIIFFIQLRYMVINTRVASPLSRFQPRFVVFENCSLSLTPLINETDDIQQLIKYKNKQQKIINCEKFGPVTSETVLVTIQVHDRIAYLSQLIGSLRKAKDISKVLLIISHDLYDEAMNQLVESIEFCMVMQIFFPFSIQTHPLVFPGEDPCDCPRNISRSDAEKIKCLNYKTPDMYDHYREAKYAQIKHHVWWRLNRIFDQLEATRDLNGYLLILEEDYYLAEDFVHVMELQQKQSLEKCSQCNILSLGGYNSNMNEKTFDQVNFLPWISYTHNMGMMINRSTWNEIKRCSSHFCDYDDYNYDWSLQNVNRNCLRDKLFVSILQGARVFHLGECGIHHAKENCNPEDKMKEVEIHLKAAKDKKLLFPSKLKVGRENFIQPSSSLKPNGGWGDARDRKLCLEIAKGLQDLSVVNFDTTEE